MGNDVDWMDGEGSRRSVFFLTHVDLFLFFYYSSRRVEKKKNGIVRSASIPFSCDSIRTGVSFRSHRSIPFFT